MSAMSPLSFSILSLLLPASNAVQPLAHPSFTPCTFPSPVYQPQLYRHFCERIPSLPFLCDLHDSIQGTPTRHIEEAYYRYHDMLFQNNRSTLGIIVARNIEQPWRSSEVYEKEELACLFTNDCRVMDTDAINGFVGNTRTFLKIWTWKAYERWFGLDEACEQPNVLVLILVDGIQNDPRKIPYVKIHTGSQKLLVHLKNIEAEAYNGLVQNWELNKVLKMLVDDIGYQLKEFHALNGEPRDHSVPYWARHVFLGCFGLVVFAMVVEWYIVRRKLAIRKSPSGIKIASGKSKTHLMF